MGETLMDGLRKDIEKIVCPVSIVWGDEDQIIHPSVAAHWEEGLSNVEMNVMPNAGHSTQMEFPREVADVIDRLMTNIKHSA
jgi:pimeloyl-ACP methyl ester carboxylesterase